MDLEEHFTILKDNTFVAVPTKSQNINNILQMSFTVTQRIMVFAFLVSFVTIFLVESEKKHQILVFECLITFISASIYLIFIRSIENNNTAGSVLKQLYGFSKTNLIDNINILRYTGWFFSTAFMLIALCLILAYNLRTTVSNTFLMKVLGLDWLMLSSGFLGEMGVIDTKVAMLFGFIPFFAMFYLIYNTFIEGKLNRKNVFIYWMYFILWSVYGLVYLLDQTTKTITTNVLDCLAKAIFAIGISIFFIIQ
jgi:bacteriorhodopsin